MCSKMLYDPENLNLENFGVVSFTFCVHTMTLDSQLAVFFFFYTEFNYECAQLVFFTDYVILFAQMFLSNVCANICIFLF